MSRSVNGAREGLLLEATITLLSCSANECRLALKAGKTTEYDDVFAW